MEFLIFSTCISLILFSFCVINLTNPIHSALYLVCCFLNAALILFLLGADFLGFVFIIVYVGAIAVFFLLVIMMLNIKSDPALFGFIKYGPLSVFISFIFVFEFFMPFIQSTSSINFKYFSTNIFFTQISTNVNIIENCQMFSQILYTHYFVFFLLVGLILLVALLGSMMLTVSMSDDSSLDSVE
jgi:NADH-quinone oxidoreductase subunit J